MKDKERKEQKEKRLCSSGISRCVAELTDPDVSVERTVFNF